MKRLIPTNTKREDCVQTPSILAKQLVEHFRPKGQILEPCKGEGFFLEAIEDWLDKDYDEVDWCEIKEGKDFFDFNRKVDWIITNPPYSKMRKFIQHSMEIAEDCFWGLSNESVKNLKEEISSSIEKLESVKC